MQKNVELAELLADVREQVLYLQELGVENLDVKFPEQNSSKLIVDSSELPDKFVPPEIPRIVQTDTLQQRSRESRLALLPTLSKRTPDVSGVPLQNTGTPVTPVTPGTPDPPEPLKHVSSETLFDITPTLPEAAETIQDIRADIGSCTRCPLWEGRTQVVHTTGNFQADLMFVGEAPGADEDAQGEPFVGRAGQLLTKIIEGIGMKREDVAIGNINRCRPPANRAPTLPEAGTCKPFLLREIAVIRPKVIVVMGNTAMHNLLDTKVGITKLRGQFQDYFGVKVMPTFHPAFLLRDPRKKREVWEDMKKVRDYLNSRK